MKVFGFIVFIIFIITAPLSAGVFDTPQKGNFALFEDATVKLRGNFQTTGVYFYERDLNGYDGDHEVWDAYEKKYIPDQTKEIEAYMYHEFTLKPSLNFFDDTINLHAEVEGGGYMWSNDYSSVTYPSTYDPPDNEFPAQPIDNEKLKVKASFLEALTPVGLFLVGRLPNSIHGVMWGLKFSSLPRWSFVLGYAKKNEGGYNLIDELGVFYSYLDTRYKDNYQDRDDETMYIFSSLFDDPNGFKSKLILANVVGGSKSPSFTELYVRTAKLYLDYTKHNWHMHFYFSYMDAMIAKLTENQSGELMQLLIDTVGNTVEMLDPVRYRKPSTEVEDIVIDPGLTLAGNISYDLSRFTPEVGFLYTPGGDRWYKASHTLPDDEDPPGNSSEKKILKDYLLNEIEDEYFTLTSTFGMLQKSTDGLDEFSYQNMKAIKAGGTWHINDKLDLFGQVLSAWRTDVTYFEKEYWDTFFLCYAYPKRLSYSANAANTDEAMTLPVILQLADETITRRSIPILVPNLTRVSPGL